MTVETVIVAGLVVLGVSMYIRHRRENPPVDMNHTAPNVHNVVENAVNGPTPAAPTKKVAKKKATKKKTIKKAVKK
jgi:hypothetical protein